MRKNELLHYHALLLGVARDFDEREALAADDLDEYRALGVTPMTIQAARDDHEEAVRTLAGLLADAAESTDAVEAAVPRDGVGGSNDGSDDPVPAGFGRK
jgi:hypothetical protein